MSQVIITYDQTHDRHYAAFVRKDGQIKVEEKTPQEIGKLAFLLDRIGAVFHGVVTQNGLAVEVVTL